VPASMTKRTWLALLLLAARPVENFDFGESWEKLQAKVNAGVDKFQEKAAEIDWEAMSEKAKEAYEASKAMAESAVDTAQSIDWKEVEAQAKAAADYSKEMASKTIQTAQAAQAHFAKINWTEVGEGLSVAGSGSSDALKSSAQAAAASAQAAAHSANSLSSTVKAVQGAGRAADAIFHPGELQATKSDPRIIGAAIAILGVLALTAVLIAARFVVPPSGFKMM